MKSRFFILTLIGIMFCIGLVGLGGSWSDNGSLTQDIDACGTLNTTNAVYNLTTNIGSGGDCLIINASGITINGNGFTITGNVNANSETNAYSDLIINNTGVVGDVIAVGASMNNANSYNGGSVTILNSTVSSVLVNGGVSTCDDSSYYHGGNGGNVNINDSTVAYVGSIGGGGAHCGFDAGGGIDDGDAGAVTVFRSTISGDIDAYGKDFFNIGAMAGGPGGAGGAVSLTNSSVNNINSYSGMGSGSISGNAGSIILINSTSANINSYGGICAANGATVSITTSTTGNILAYGGAECHNPGYSGMGGSVTITNSTTGSIGNYGGDALDYTYFASESAGHGGSVDAINSIIQGNIDSYGGECSVQGNSGNGGGITLTNSTALNVNSFGGDYIFGSYLGAGGLGGAISLTNSNVSSIYSDGGDGVDAKNAGNVFMNNSYASSISAIGGNGVAGMGGNGGSVEILNGSVFSIASYGGACANGAITASGGNVNIVSPFVNITSIDTHADGSCQSLGTYNGNSGSVSITVTNGSSGSVVGSVNTAFSGQGNFFTDVGGAGGDVTIVNASVVGSINTYAGIFTGANGGDVSIVAPFVNIDSIKTGTEGYASSPTYSGDGGDVSVTVTNLSSNSIVGSVTTYGSTEGLLYGGAGGDVTIVNASVVGSIATYGMPCYSANMDCRNTDAHGGSVTIIAPFVNIGSIDAHGTTPAGEPTYGYGGGGNGGVISISVLNLSSNSQIGNINSVGGNSYDGVGYGGPGNGGSVSIENASVSGYVYSYGGLAWNANGGNGGSISLINSGATSGDIIAKGGNSWNSYVSGNGASIFIYNSTVGNVDSSGGGYESGIDGGTNGGASGGITIQDSIILGYVYANGGAGDFGNGGPGSSIAIANSSVAGSISADGGSGYHGYDFISGAAGPVSVTNSNITSVSADGGAGATGATPTDGGSVSISDSKIIGSVTAIGGVGELIDSSGHDGANGGSIGIGNLLSGSNIESIDISGGISAVGNGGDGGEISVSALGLSLDSQIGNINSFGGEANTGVGGAGGNVTLTNVNVLNVTSTGGAGAFFGGNGGGVSATNSNATIISSVGGNALETGDDFAGNGGDIFLINSNVTALNSLGGTADDNGGNSGIILLINSTSKDITSRAGDGSILSSATNGGSSGNITLTNSNATTITSMSGAGNSYAGNSGAITLTNSQIINITSIGGDAAYGNGGDGGIITLTNSNATSITSTGGAVPAEIFNGGSGGDVSISNSNLNLTNVIINLIGGAGLSNGVAGLLTLNYTTSFVDTNADYGSKIKLKLIENNVGIVDFTSEMDSSSWTNLSSRINISNNFAYVNSSALPTLNAPANINFYNISTGFVSPRVLKDGLVCNDCYNFTNLNAGDVSFNVSSWSNYTIGEGILNSSLIAPVNTTNTSTGSNNYTMNFTGNTPIQNVVVNFIDSFGNLFTSGASFGELNNNSPLWDDSLVSVWNLNGDATDAKGSNDGTWSGTESYADGMFETQAGSFDGIDDYMFANRFDGSGAFTFSAWIKYDSLSDTYAVPFANGDDDPFTGFNLGYRLPSDRTLRAGWGSSTAEVAGVVSDDGVWYLVTSTYNGSTHKFYVNGVPQGSAEYSSSNFWSGLLNLGALRSDVFFFDGSIDNVAIWNRALTADEVASLYSQHNMGTVETTVGIVVTLVDGVYNWFYSLFDWMGNEYRTENRTITIDTTAPRITNIVHTPNSTDAIDPTSNITIRANVTDNIIGVNWTRLKYFAGNYTMPTTIFDSSGNGNNGTIVGATFGDGKLNGGMEFDGSDSSIQGDALNISTDLTFNGWIKTTDITNYGYMYSMMGGNYPGGVFIIGYGGDSALVYYNGCDYPDYRRSINYGSISGTLRDGKWHMISAIVDSSSMTFTIKIDDGNLFSETVPLPAGSGGLCTPTSSDISGRDRILEYFTGSMDEISIFNRSLSTEEISEIYNSGTGRELAGNENGLVAYYPMNDAINGFSASEMINVGDNVYEANITLIPTDSNYTYFIESEDNLGNYNISSARNFTSTYDCTWNITPTALGSFGGYNAIGTTPKLLKNLTINNTGDANYSGGCNIVFSDFSTTPVMHNLTSNYFSFPGIYPLRFREGIDVFDSEYDGGITSITVAPNSSKILATYADFPASLSVLIENPYFTITSSVNDTINNRKYLNVTARLVVTPGAYLETVVESPTTNQLVYLRPQNLSLSAYAKNVADGRDSPNNTAYNFSFNLNVPSVLSSRFANNFSIDNLTYFNETVNTTDKFTIAPTVEFTAANLEALTSDELSIATGIAFVSVSSVASGYENSTGNLSLIKTASNQTIFNSSVNIILSCVAESDGYKVPACGALDGDYVAPSAPDTTGSSGGGGGGGGGGGSFDKSSATFSLIRGESQEFELTLDNKLDFSKSRIKILVTGNNSQYVSVDPKVIDYLGPKSSSKIKVIIDAPSYFASGKFLLQFEFRGFIEGNTSTPFTEVKYITLEILEMSKEEASGLVNKSIVILDEMTKSGLYLTDVQNILDQMKSNYDSLNYNSLREASKKISDIYTAATESVKLMNEINASIIEAEKNGVSVPETKKLLYLAQIIFNRGDYINAYAKLKEAKSSLLLETKGEFNLLYAIKNKPIESLGILISLSLVGIGGGYLMRIRFFKRKLRLLGEEEMLLLQLIKVVQRDCFENNRMSMEEYNEAMVQYENRLSEIIQTRINIETKIANLMKFSGKRNALMQEQARLLALVRQVQDDYLNREKIETRAYENMLKTYSGRLNGIQEELAFMDAQEQIKQANGFWKRLMGKG